MVNKPVSPEGIILTDEMQALVVEEFGDKTSQYIEGYIDGITQATQAVVDEAMISLMAVVPIKAYLKGLKGEVSPQ